MCRKIKNTTSLIRTKLRITMPPSVGIVLGSGLGTFANEIVHPVALPYTDIPGFPTSTVEGHSGRFVYGNIQGIPVIAMQGRIHFYEGYTMDQVTMPIRIMADLGVKTLILSNAAGGLDPAFTAGDIMLITDHINLLPNPLIGPNDAELGVRFPPMHDAYDPLLRETALQTACEMGLSLKQGIYIASSGPSYETPAEYRFFRLIGASATGMSTVPEVIIARHQNMKVLAFSLISNTPENPASHDEVQQVGLLASQKFNALIKNIIPKIPASQ